MKKKIILSLVIAFVVGICAAAPLFVSAGTDNRAFTEDDVKSASEAYIEDFKKSVESNKQKLLADNELPYDKNDEEALKTDAVTYALSDETDKVLGILRKYGKDGYDVSAAELYHDVTKYYRSVNDLCDIYSDRSNDLTLDEAAAIRVNILYLGGSVKLSVPVNTAEKVDDKDATLKMYNETVDTVKNTFHEEIAPCLFYNTDITG